MVRLFYRFIDFDRRLNSVIRNFFLIATIDVFVSLCFQEYDYVFSVDIEDGKPPLKLPFNVTEDPWFAAQRFLEQNNLSQLFLDQVAKFIIDNTKGVILGQETSGYADPFTGRWWWWWWSIILKESFNQCADVQL